MKGETTSCGTCRRQTKDGVTVTLETGNSYNQRGTRSVNFQRQDTCFRGHR